MATTEKIDIISEIDYWWALKLFKMDPTTWILLHRIGGIKKEDIITVEKFLIKFFRISIVVLHDFLTIHTSAPNWLKRSGSASGGLIYKKNDPIRQFKNSVEIISLSRSIALLRSVVTFLTFLLDWLTRSFDDLLLAEHLWKANIETWQNLDLVSQYHCHGYLSDFPKCAWLQRLSRTVVCTLGLLFLGLRNLKLIFLM